MTDPTEKISVIDKLFDNFKDSFDLEAQNACAKALFNKGWTLGEKLHNPQAAIDTYDLLWQHFQHANEPAIQELCARALLGKGFTLERIGNTTDSITTFKKLLEHYKDSENPKIINQYQDAEANLAELLLVTGQTTEAIPLLHQVLARTDTTQQKSAVMSFLLWVANEYSLEQVLHAIHALSPEATFTWDWNDIRPLLNQLPEPKYSQAKCFLDYFENHHQIDQLEQCLANISST